MVEANIKREKGQLFSDSFMLCKTRSETPAAYIRARVVPNYTK